MTTVYGDVRTWDEFYFSYAVDAAGRVAVVRHDTDADTAAEVARMKLSDSRLIGRTTCKVDELTLRKMFRSRGWRIAVVR